MHRDGSGVRGQMGPMGLNKKIMMVKPPEKVYHDNEEKPLKERSGDGFEEALKEVFGMEIAWDIYMEDHKDAVLIRTIGEEDWKNLHNNERKKIALEFRRRFRWSDDKRFMNISSKALWFLEEEAAMLNVIEL